MLAQVSAHDLAGRKSMSPPQWHDLKVSVVENSGAVLQALVSLRHGTRGGLAEVNGN
jgi:hypothetical protein